MTLTPFACVEENSSIVNPQKVEAQLRRAFLQTNQCLLATRDQFKAIL